MQAKYFLIVLIQFSIQVYSQSDLEGTYITKKPSLGILRTEIHLNADGTFIYDFKGDLAHNWGNGEYEIDTEYVLILKFRESDLDLKEQARQATSGGSEIFERTMFYVYKRGRLFPLLESGKIDRQGRLIRCKAKKIN